jgi:phage protein D
MGGSAQPGNVMPSISVGKPLAIPIMPPYSGQLIRAVVDTHLHLPGMFELHYDDQAGDILDNTNLHIGATVEINAAKYGEQSSTTIMKGEVTAIEAICENMSTTTVIRGYEKAHRLQRARRSQTFVNMTDSDIANQIASHAGLSDTDITSTDTVHPHIAQVAQTDWEFLQQRAREIGFECGVANGTFFFRKSSNLPDDSALGALASAASSVASALGLGNSLTYKDNLFRFYPRLNGANITPDVEVRFWDSRGARVVVGSADAKTGAADLDDEPADLANSFTDGLIDLPSLPAMPKIPGLKMPDFGSAPSKTAFVVVDHPLGYGDSADDAADDMAKSLADHMASGFAEAEGEAVGDPSLIAGVQIDVKGVPGKFKGKWTLTNARHVFDPMELGYRVHFIASGRGDRTMLGLTSAGLARSTAPQIHGLVCGVVTSCDDPDSRGRVQVTLPWLSKDFVTDWARVVQLTAGQRAAAVFIPEVGDEVLVGFEFGDARRPYVIGGLINDNVDLDVLSNAVSGGDVVNRGISSPSELALNFNDSVTKPQVGPYSTSEITLGTGDGNLSLSIDQGSGAITLTCTPTPTKSGTAAGTLTIDCSGAGQIEIKGGAGGVKVESDGQLELTGKLGVKISSNAMVQVQGQMVQLN